MARASKVKPGQVWTDARGRHLQVTQNPGPDGKYQVKNLETGRTMLRGPRALVNMVQDAPFGDAGQPYPGSHRAAYGGPFRASGPEDEYEEPAEEPIPAPYGMNPFGAWGGHAPAPARRAPPPPRARAVARRAPPPRRAPAAQRTPAPVMAPPGYSSNPTSYPSPLTQFVAERLAAMPVQHAHSTSMVSRVVGGALAEWKSRPPAHSPYMG